MRETAIILQKTKSWVAKWSSSQDFPTSLEVVDQTEKKQSIKEAVPPEDQQTEEQRSAWICSNSVEIYVQQGMETFEAKSYHF